MRIELRKYHKSKQGYQIVAKCADNQNPMVIVRRLAKDSDVLAQRISWALGTGQAAFGLGQRDTNDVFPLHELGVSVPNMKYYELAIIETNEYERSQALHFHKMITTTKRDV